MGQVFASAVYTVTFKDYNGTILKTQTVNHGGDATPPANPVLEGHTFTGWSEPYTNVTSDKTITAWYNTNAYTIIFHNNVDRDGEVYRVNGWYGDPIWQPADPWRTGYTFDGWYKEAELIHAWDFERDTMPAGGTTLYAKWVVKSYTVIFKNYNGTILKTQTVNHGGDATPPANPVREGHTFSGWSEPYTNVTSDKTITAWYNANAYTMFFNSNGGTNVPQQSAWFGGKLTKPQDPWREGYNFSGWYKEAELTNAWNFGNDTMPGQDMTLYAKWTIKTYTVTFENDNGSILKTETVDHGGYATAPDDPTRTGYTFTGWNGVYTNVTSDRTITAQYSVNYYTVNFESNGGLEVPLQTV
ncbi:InlB B-repeat-containing protein, partial [Paenibacillus sp. MAHUQ-46]